MKRSAISPDRLKELQSGGVYVITCCIDQCPCLGKDKNCGRGFFSLFLQAINGIDFADSKKIPYHVDYGNGIYSYSDAARESNNFWNYYFEQPIKLLSSTNKSSAVINRFMEIYPLRIWHKSYFRQKNKRVVSQLKWKEDVKKHLGDRMIPFKNKKVLGVQARLTDHFNEIEPVSRQTYLRTIARNNKNFDLIFVATDDQSFLNSLIGLYADRVIYNNVTRSMDDKAVHSNPNYSNRFKLGLDVLSDCYCLSQCDKLILVSSNVSYSALLFNPHVPYILLERPSAKIKRWKTLLLYLLDKWGIRKW